MNRDNKGIMITIKPDFCVKIMNKEKTIELRKNKVLAQAIQKLINKNGYAEIYAYCSKNKKLIYNHLSGKVLFKFRCYNLKTIRPSTCDDMYFKSYGLFTHQINNYLNNNIGFEIYISNLEIFNTPKSLNDFGIIKAPQNFCYINTGGKS